ncbi:MAG: hypothetical protein K2X74_08370 [Acetobacteraceae bacterium]|nr:hypothetical protein [Acetobacteraceae bacterium]
MLALALPLLAAMPAAAQQAPAQQAPAQQAPAGPPHAWAYGVWTGGLFPAGETDTPACYANATVIILRDVVLRASVLDIVLRQRLIETVGPTAEGGLQFRLVPAAPVGSALGSRVPPDGGFGCEGGPDALRIERRGPNEIVFPDCREFLSPLKRCGAGG